MDDTPPPAGLIGAYRLQARLGRGASADVWRAVRADGRGAPVALKLMRASLPERAHRQRAAEQIQHEGNILAALRHPNIAALRDAGTTAEGQAFLVLELVDGEPLDAHCRRLRLDIDARLRLSLKVLRAVAHAHQHLVVHGDIKPANVMVDRSGEVKLLDFGVARRLGRPADTDPSVATPMADRATGVAATAPTTTTNANANANTNTGTATATALSPRHAAPELLDRGEWSTASDVYALGVLMYELLGGCHPTARTGAGDAEQLHAALHRDPAPVSRWDPQRTAADADPARVAAERGTTRAGLSRRLAGDLDRLLAKMLSKSPGDRYPTVDAVCEDVERHLNHQPISVRPASWRYSAGKFLRRYRAPVAAGALVSMALTAGAVGTLSQAATAQKQTTLALREQALAEARLKESEATIALAKGILCDALSAPRPPAQTLAHAEAWVLDKHANDPAVRAHLLDRLAHSHLEQDDMASARKLFGEAITAARQAGDRRMQAVAQCGDAMAAARLFDAPAARALYSTALDTLRAPGGLGAQANTNTNTNTNAQAQAFTAINGTQGTTPADHRLDDGLALARCLTAASTAESVQGNDPQRARQFGEDAVRVASSLGPSGRRVRYYAQQALASALSETGQWAAAESIHGELAAELAEAGREQSLASAHALALHASNLIRGGQKLRALEQQRRSLAIELAIRETRDVHAVTNNNLGSLMVDVGDHEAGGRALDDALATATANRETTLVAIVQLNRARLHCELNDAAGCRALAEAGLKVLEPLVPPGHARRANIAILRALVALTEGKLVQAERQLRVAVDVQTKTQGKPLPNTLARLARVKLANGQRDAAQRDAEAAVALAREAMGGFQHSEALGVALLAMGEVQQARGDAAAAKASYDQALANLVDALGPGAAPTRDVARRIALLSAP